uniref:ATP-dependent Clp protease proteolytic subunit n=1 Tax=Tetraselmis sp. GSL018 TaxID=582737 RepID=A0A061RTA6_9CHLO|mmetsp:Transcript_30767/g.73268  ORF Transcript_30767/g.73268 Transcript_30767/m.73268 type:complete len:270 (+) Transcript_30767:94-903(+)
MFAVANLQPRSAPQKTQKNEARVARAFAKRNVLPPLFPRTATRPSRRNLHTVNVIPQLGGDAYEQAPPDLPSYLFKERIVYLGMSLVPSVTELLLAELLYLQYDAPNKPVYMYINSTGVQKGGDKLGYEAEAFAIYDTMRYVKPPIYTVAVGSAFGEAAMLLAAGEKGRRAALPSATIMLRQPIQRFQQMQASDIDIYRNEIRKTNREIVELLAKHTNHETEEIERDILRPKYFDPYAAVEYGIIDKVLSPDEADVRKVVEESRKGAYQ